MFGEEEAYVRHSVVYDAQTANGAVARLAQDGAFESK
jgi:hypothetical protein